MALPDSGAERLHSIGRQSFWERPRLGLCPSIGKSGKRGASAMKDRMSGVAEPRVSDSPKVDWGEDLPLALLYYVL
jgi:hypothetical protein